MRVFNQINREQDSVPLVPGQRVVIPRHLAPLAAAYQQSPPKR
jgi:hypothetical protein